MDAKKIQVRLGVPADGVLGPQTWAAMFRHMGARDAAGTLGKGAAEHFQTFGLVEPLRGAHWFGQFTVESAGFTRFEENLNYSAERLCKVWPNRFPTLASAQPYANNPKALANKVYGLRMGNSAPDDGWLYHGRGPQITGKENYAAIGRRTGLPLLSHPELAADPANFVLIACDFWVAARCNEAADDDNLVLVTKRVNGGSIGIQDRRQALERAKKILC
jgi:putative chitinase